jgi:steroid delta-isomerase-like uncharacterized protein
MSEQKKLVRNLVEDVWSEGKFEVVDRLVDARYIGHSSPAGTETRGTEGYRQYFADLRAAFPDLHVSVEDEIEEGDRVVVRWTARATHLGTFAGVPASGRRGEVAGISIYRIADGKVIECWTNMDNLGLLQQIGAFPVAAPAT